MHTITILKKIETYIHENKLCHHNNLLIIGLSGGPDSIFLINILQKLGYNCIAAHCNFHLRKEESKRDANFVEKYCKEHDIRLEYIDFETEKYAVQHHISIEMAARELRYNWFEEIRIKHHADYIAIAHHSDDSVETVLLNLIRGTGIRGLTGINNKHNHIIRPLLCLNREEILTYLNANDIPFVIDSTNRENIYIRNKIRLDIIPKLIEINPSAKNAIIKTTEYLTQVEKIYNYYVENTKKEIQIDNKINIEKLISTIEPKAILFECLLGYGFNSSIIEDIYSSINNGICGKIFYSNTHRLLKDRQNLIIENIQQEVNNHYLIYEDTITINSPIHLEINKIVKTEKFNIKKNNNYLYIDVSKIKYPLMIRKWQKGDRFTPFGMKGSKKLSDFFSDHKYSIFDKENSWLLCSENQIVWIIGKRCDNRFKIDENTSMIIEMQLIL